ncbi:uncharacterized protein LOC135331751 [Halichondria panicea]|uniref:uncharacterized protein LOC135331751 n=1 Tax=Halichondria panicea TaxID=6063 RepID=UPI00312B9CBE
MEGKESGGQPPPPPSPMQESWVDVPGGEGKLVYNRSKEELVEMLASAVSEPEMSDSETMYGVTFKPCSDSQQEDESPSESPISSDPPQVPHTIAPVQEIATTQNFIQRPAAEAANMSEERSSGSQSSCSNLFWCVPVFILTHLAIFGIGYYLGRRIIVEPSPLKLLHV